MYLNRCDGGRIFELIGDTNQSNAVGTVILGRIADTLCEKEVDERGLWKNLAMILIIIVIFGGSFLDKIYLLPLFLFPVISVTLLWLEIIIGWIFKIVAGLFIQHPVEVEGGKWKRKKGMPMALDFKAIARKMYDRGEGIPTSFESWLKKERLKKLGKRLDAEKEFMGKVEEHERRRRKNEE